MFFKSDGATLKVKDGPQTPARAITLTGFGFISSARWCQTAAEVLVCATPKGSNVPRVGASANEKGDRRLFRWKPDGLTGWQEVYRGYAGDVVRLSGDTYAVAGLTFLDGSGAVIRENAAGRFSWGAPSLSASPSGNAVAWIQWKGDDQKLRVDNVDGSVSSKFIPSIFRYAWLDDSHIVFSHGVELRLLDIDSGGVRRFGKGVKDLISAALGVPRTKDIWTSVSELKVVGERVWFTGALVNHRSGTRTDGLFSVDNGGAYAQVEVLMPAVEHPRELIDAFVVTDDLSVVVFCAGYENGWRCSERTLTFGPLASFLSDGWVPLRESREPDFANLLPTVDAT